MKTREEITKALETSSNIREVLLKLSLVGDGANYGTLKRQCKKLNIDLEKILEANKLKQKEKQDAITDAEVRNAVETHQSFRSVLLALGISETNYRWIRQKVKKLKIDTLHFTGQGHLKGKTHSYGEKLPIEDILIENSTYSNTHNLKQKLLNANLMVYHCSICQINTWNDKHLVLQLDHINGVNTDNRIENLRLLCPNCHSQTDTFCSKNSKKVRTKTIYKCIHCSKQLTMKTKTGMCVLCCRKFGKKGNQYSNEFTNTNVNCLECRKSVTAGSRVCKDCYNSQRTKYQKPMERKTKIKWPSDERLLSMLKASNFLQLSKKLGVSDNAIRKRLQRKGLL